MGKHLVLVGGGHAHLTSLKNLPTFRKRGHQVTLISPYPYHYYSGMGPGMLSGIYGPQEVRFHVKRMAEGQGAAFIRDKVIKVDPERRILLLSSGEKVTYDRVSFNTGSEVPIESLTRTPRDNIVTVKPVINLYRARHAILNALSENKTLSLAVIGGGPAGVEISANLWRLLHVNKTKGEIALIGGRRLMGEAPEKVRHLALESLIRKGVRVIEGTHVKTIEDRIIRMSDGREVGFDMTFVATGIRPSSFFRESNLPSSADGGLLVNSYLQSTAYPDIFGGGDCISLEGHPLAKVGVHAVRENPVLYHNLLAALEGGKMMAFRPREHFLLIFNMGDGQGIFWKKNWIWENRLAFLLKDYIDRRFMRKFQISGELDEKSESAE